MKGVSDFPPGDGRKRLLGVKVRPLFCMITYVLCETSFLCITSSNSKTL